MLTATPKLSFINSPDTHAICDIKYDLPFQVQIHERRNDSSNLSKRTIPVEFAESGSFEVQLKPGDKHEVFINRLDRDFNNPYTGDPTIRPDATVTARALKGEGEDITIDRIPFTHGGTYCEFALAAKDPSIKAPYWGTMEVGKLPPVTSDTGDLVMPDPIGFSEAEGPSTLHFVIEQSAENEALIPGHRYFALTRFTDKVGRWQRFEHDFTTKERQVTVNLKDMHIVEDSDFDTETDVGKFLFEIHELTSRGKQHDVLKSWYKRYETFNTGQDLNLNLMFTDTQKTITDINAGMGIFLRGIEEDDPDADDIAETARGKAVPLKFETGRDEEMVNAKQTIQANERYSSDDLEYDVHVVYSVKYL